MILPKDFEDNMRDLLQSSADDFFLSLDSPEVKALTVDMNKISEEDVRADSDLNIEKIDGLYNGYYYSGKIGDNILHHAGCIYSQDASAQIPVEALGIEKNDIVLDVCSAPGGKSIQILQRLNNTGLLLSNEYVYNRAKILYENIVRFGYSNYIVTSNLPDVFDNKYNVFDKIIVDAPCSGEGMFRKSNVDTYSWSMANVKTSAVRQYEILQSVKNALKVGGKLVYSTCTYNIEENEKVVARFLQANPEFRLLPLPENIASITARGIDIDGHDTHMCGRRYPHMHRGEGQFVALMEKVSGSNRCINSEYQIVSKKDRDVIEHYLSPILDISDMHFHKKGDNIYAVPDVVIDISNMNVTSLGVYVGTLDKKGIDISHSFYKAFGHKFYNIVNLNRSEAEVYITGNVVDLTYAKSGICAVCYNNINLGGGKVVQGVLKNYYPKQLRKK
ncbi:MAG: hypothetical protein E7361_02205 [Clostridiales bacterium]|nr:hypothetical protein [Clostridiales bacterium]